MNYLSVCSGIEAASVAWEPLGWRCNGVAEIEPFPSAVLKHHYPQVHNFGDMTKFKDWPNDPTIDVLVGGTPCQSFSVAGLRKGLDDPRGNLALTFLGIADRYGPEWLIWENVPGVLSLDEGRAFGSILGGMAELGYHVSYRVLDAQYVRVDGLGRAVPQRRRRVFVVGNLRDWRRSAAVLFEPESLSWDTAPRREAGQGIAPTISSRPTGGVGLGTDFDCDGGLVSQPLLAKSNSSHDDSKETYVAVASTGDVAHCLNAGGMGRQDYETETVIAHALRGEGFDASEDGRGRGTPLVATFDPRNVTSKANRTRVEFGEPSNTLHEKGLAMIAFDCKASGRNGFGEGQISPTLRAMGNSKSHANAGGQVAVAIQERAVSENLENGPQGKGYQDGLAFTLEARNKVQAVATAWAVRRLTPLECERLQGFPDGYTDVPYRGKNWTPDGPRYKALGNSMAVNCMRWLGQRIEMVSALCAETST